jgi:hypothetical protein
MLENSYAVPPVPYAAPCARVFEQFKKKKGKRKA